MPANEQYFQITGDIKVKYKMSLADAYAAALSISTRSILVTGDKEFKPLENVLIKIVWI